VLAKQSGPIAPAWQALQIREQLFDLSLSAVEEDGRPLGNPRAEAELVEQPRRDGCADALASQLETARARRSIGCRRRRKL